MRQFLFILIALFMFCTPVLAADSIETLEKELVTLEQELPEVLKEETDLDTRQDYVNRVLELRENIEALEGEEEQSEGFYYKLVAIESTVKQGEEKNGKAIIGIEFDKETTTFKWVKDATADKYNYIETQSFGFEEYPEKVILGEPYIVKASAISQKDIYPGYCWKADEQKLINTLQIRVGFGDSKGIQENLYSISDCKNSKSSQTVHVGGRIDIEVRCESEKPKYFGLQGGYLYYEYKCKMTSSETPGQWKKIAGQPIKIYVKKDADDKPIKNEDGGYILAPPDEGTEPSKMNYDIALGGTYEYLTHTTPIRLIYKPVYTKDEALENTSTVQHTVEVNNSVEQGESEDQDKDGDEDNQNQQQNEGNSSSADNPAQSTGSDNAEAARQKKERGKHIKYWLKHAEPVENAQPGYTLKYDKWGRVEGKAPNGNITLAKPDSAGLSPADYAWVRADTIDSLNLCTLKEYVERKLAGKETASCQKDIPQQQAQTQPLKPDSLRDFVGMEAAKAKTDLEKLGVKIKWKSGSIAKDTAQQGLIEKQNPAPGTNLKNVKEVELWTYRYAAKSVLVPDVTRMPYKDAIARLKQEGLVPSIGKVQEPTIILHAGTVLRQKTKPGTKVSHGATVVLDIFSGGSAQASMPDVIGLKYEEAAQKVKEAGLKPLKKLGPYASRPEQPGTVKDSGMATGRKLDIGTAVTLTVYNTYSEKTVPQKQPEEPPAANQNWAGMWHVKGKYDMELHVSDHKVKGRYGEDMEKTIEGEMSGNVLTGWWREGKTYGRFENTMSDDGNSWSGHWNMMKEKLGGWNGGWSATRIGKRKSPQKQPEKIVKSDPARQSSGSNSGNSAVNVPSHMKCDAGVSGLRTDNKQRVGSTKNGEVGVRDNVRANYVCWYKTSRGEEVLVKPSFFVRKPATREAGGKGRNLIAFCDRPAYNDVYGVGAHGRAMKITIGKYSAQDLSQGQLQALVSFHTSQMARYAISCR